MTKTASAKLVPHPEGEKPRGKAQLVELHYDVWTLRVTVDIDKFDGVVYVDFESPCGFRVLDEEDLGEMWADGKSDRRWFYTVESSGWLAQENERPGFSNDPEELTEYFIAGVNECVSILAEGAPTITVIDAD
jgi:hypothetical protein